MGRTAPNKGDNRPDGAGRDCRPREIAQEGGAIAQGKGGKGTGGGVLTKRSNF